MNAYETARRQGTHGFTLVEAVVVAVIMGILAAVAIPMYLGYIQDQRQTTVNNLAETAAAAANAFLRRTGTNPSSTDQLNVHYNAAKYAITIDACDSTITAEDQGNTCINSTVYYGK